MSPETANSASDSEGCFYPFQEVGVGLERRKVGIVGLDLVRRAEEEAGLGGADHAEVVEAVAGGDGSETAGL